MASVGPETVTWPWRSSSWLPTVTTAGSRGIPPGQRHRYLPGDPRPDHAVPDHDQEPPGDSALRLALVSHRGLHLDGREPRPPDAGSVPHPRNQQRGLPRPVNPLRGGVVDTAAVLCPHLFLSPV